MPRRLSGAAHDTRASRILTQPHALPDSAPCPNCGEATPGNFCPRCGQRRIERRISLRRLILDAVEDQLSLNAALPRTIRTLVTRPGQLTTEYIAGRIARYIPPFRLYLIASFVFFLALQFVGGARVDVWTTGSSAAADSVPPRRSAADSMPPQRPARDSVPAGSPRDPAPAAENEDAEEVNSSVFRYLPAPARARVRARLRALGAMPEHERTLIFQREFLSRAPIAAFVLVPVFAALLALLYLRSRRYYVEHFVFALHIHTAGFLLATVLLPLEPWPLVQLALEAWLLWYFFQALRRVYGQGVLITLVKFLVLGVAYLVVLLATMLVTLIAALLLSPI